MQIQNASLQLADYASPFEKTTPKPEQKNVEVGSGSDKPVKEANSEKLKEVAKVLEENNISLTFSQDQETKAIVVRLVDKVTGEEIRQIPNEVSLKLAAVNAKIQGNFIDEVS